MYKLIIPAGVALSTALLASTAIANNEATESGIEEIIINDTAMPIVPGAAEGNTILAQLQAEKDMEDDCEDDDEDEDEDEDEEDDEDDEDEDEDDNDAEEEACAGAATTQQG